MKRSLLVVGTVVGVLLALGPVWSMVVTVFGMRSAFQALSGPDGIAAPQAVSDKVGSILNATWAGFAACPVGIALLIVCIVQLTKRHKNLPPNSATASVAPPQLPS